MGGLAKEVKSWLCILYMMIKTNTQNTDIVILCGGLGTRLRPVIGERQKVTAEVGPKPFLVVLINYIRRFGFSHFVLCTGFAKEEVYNAIQEQYGNEKQVSLEFSDEKISLGTGGAIKKALPLIKSDPFIVVNGDTFSDIDFFSLFDFHDRMKSSLSIVLARSTREDGGNIIVDKNSRVTSFQEKQNKPTLGYINAGVYMVSKNVVPSMPAAETFSLEHDFFPEIVKTERCFGYIHKGEMLDIGTPERYAYAEEYFKARGIEV